MKRVAKLSTHLTTNDLNAENLFNINGKVALITGGSIGIGLMMAKTLVANGARVYICSRKSQACEDAVIELNALAGNEGRAISLPGDLSSIQGVVDVVDHLTKKESHLNILINNAGATWGAPLEEYPDAAWERVMNLNVRHLFNLTQKLLPLLKNGSQFGDPGVSLNHSVFVFIIQNFVLQRVVNIASVDGIRASQTFGPNAAFAYTASKGAVVHLTKALCRALSPFQITVNCICPGVFRSKMTQFMLSSSTGEKILNQSNPLKRIGRTSDIGGTALYLCSSAGAFTNGAIIPLDGGQHLHSEIFPDTNA